MPKPVIISGVKSSGKSQTSLNIAELYGTKFKRGFFGAELELSVHDVGSTIIFEECPSEAEVLFVYNQSLKDPCKLYELQMIFILNPSESVSHESLKAKFICINLIPIL